MKEILFPHITTMTDDGKEHATDLITHEFNRNRAVYLYGEIDGRLSLSILTQIRYLAGKSNDDIFLIINSPGGSVTDGLAIYDLMAAVDCDVATVGTGIVASMGAFLLAGGAPGKRYATPNAEIMIHQPLGGVTGQATDISLVAEHIQKMKIKLANMLSENTGKQLQELMSDMERDFWLSPENSRNYGSKGLIDIIGYPEMA